MIPNKQACAIVIIALLRFPFLVQAMGPNQYCCWIAKCLWVQKACDNDVDCKANCKLQCNGFSNLNDYVQLKDPNFYKCVQDHKPKQTVTNPGLYADDKRSLDPLDLQCGQTYMASQHAALDLFVDFNFCSHNCAGWTISQAGKPNQWAAPLLQYILPAVIFSMTIPRRRKLEVPARFFKFKLNQWTHLLKIVWSISMAGIIVTLDTFIWVFEIFSGAGPMLVGGLHEAVLDYRVVNNLHRLQRSKKNQNVHLSLDAPEKGELLLAVLAGNLVRNTNSPKKVKPEEILRRVVGLRDGSGPSQVNGVRLSAALLRMLNMLSSQYSFGSIVGAAVLFYIGSFVYQVSGLTTNKGDNDTSHALAFGQWWMVVVHVAIVSGCLLASNNPSTVTAILAEELADKDGKLPKRTTRHFKRHFGRKLVYPGSVFEPVPLFDRGVMKKCWIENTAAWKNQEDDWFKKRVRIHGFGYVMIALVAFGLVFLPSMLGFIVSYSTPRICLSCRSLTFTLYTVCQTLLIIASTWRSYTYHETDDRPAVDNLYREVLWEFQRLRTINVVGAWVFMFGVAITVLAVIGSLFTGFGGTLMQIIGVYRNCKCNIPIMSWRHPEPQWINIASDTMMARNSSKFWTGCGITAILFMAIVCYLGWYYQKLLRSQFERRVNEIAEQEFPSP